MSMGALQILLSDCDTVPSQQHKLKLAASRRTRQKGWALSRQARSWGRRTRTMHKSCLLGDRLVALVTSIARSTNHRSGSSSTARLEALSRLKTENWSTMAERSSWKIRKVWLSKAGYPIRRAPHLPTWCSKATMLTIMSINTSARPRARHSGPLQCRTRRTLDTSTISSQSSRQAKSAAACSLTHHQ